ncbi:hypothetical protein [Chitinimonas sp. BJB300]|uniref:hypothetical protein n=1 Tax=Chitinimonas sp. BJB300 TaxID=1559339 RepID=UPI001642C4B3|nr:hypothetical protein [Chitinimonas sp. BJB300]
MKLLELLRILGRTASIVKFQSIFIGQVLGIYAARAQSDAAPALRTVRRAKWCERAMRAVFG